AEFLRGCTATTATRTIDGVLARPTTVQRVPRGDSAGYSGEGPIRYRNESGMARSGTETERDGEMRSEKVQPEKSKAEALTSDPDKALRVLSPAESKAIYCIKQ